MWSYCLCCWCDKNTDSASIASALEGKFQNSVPDIKQVEEFLKTTTKKSVTIVQQEEIATITQPTSYPSPASPVAVEGEDSRRGSILSGSTIGDYPFIDVRLGLFEEERFKDVSEAIFKHHS